MKSVLSLLAGFTLVFAGLFFFAKFNQPEIAGAALARNMAPDWTLRDVDGKAVRGSDFKGKVVVLNFWATRCPPCVEEMPGLVRLQEQYRAKGLVIVGVSFDQEGPAVVKPFMARMKMNFPVVFGTEKFAEDYGSGRMLPTTFIINREGRVTGKYLGPFEKAELEKEIAPLL